MPYTCSATQLPEVLVLEPKVVNIDRGFCFESFSARDFLEATGYHNPFVQDLHTRATHGVLVGIHYQIHHPHGKLVRVIAGRVFNVAVDLRKYSPSFGRSVGMAISSDKGQQLWIPPGFGHGFVVLSDAAEVLIKATDYAYAGHQRSVRWNDADLAIAWPAVGTPIIAAADAQAPCLRDAELFMENRLLSTQRWKSTRQFRGQVQVSNRLQPRNA
ncbi:dTDP-4-dehydrorhamnose 3,5-epimerase [Noviherbaspirillum sp. DKR-6]|uniref:dTDP-4-dehydrorhamnose 3,5-epimerase n=1 Tax=Noviherbaspirillum pedocola TaxID=2801341 RepID=A0A934W8J4_9BURK|nr:dTDP-4-dehydrorhamnose 3,5-epimerase [Noviherbaspirillum pedocola]